MADKLTNAERRERRRQAARKGIETRNRKALAQAEAEANTAALMADPFAQLADRIAGATPPGPPRLETADERAAKAHQVEDKRLTNLRGVLRRAQEIRRESDLYHFAHVQKWHHSPKRWTSAQVDEARRFVESFVSPDGIAQADPIRRKGKWRL